jgi:hypothetical protein
MNCLTVRTGSEGWITSAFGTSAMFAMGEKSRTGSNGSFEYIDALMTKPSGMTCTV